MAVTAGGKLLAARTAIALGAGTLARPTFAVIESAKVLGCTENAKSPSTQRLSEPGVQMAALSPIT